MPKSFKFSSFIVSAMLLLMCCLLNGCGTKGPLYIPEQQYPQANAAQQ